MSDTSLSVCSVEEILAHAKAIEEEAQERYRDLARQMEVHHNAEVATLFRRMVDIEGLHIEKILERAKGVDIPHMAAWDYQWIDEEAPESITPTDVHYMMTPHHALSLALRAEKGAYEFFSKVCECADPGPALELAQELREEEGEHIQLMQEWLDKYPEPEGDWQYDPDPVNVVD